MLIRRCGAAVRRLESERSKQKKHAHAMRGGI